MQNQQGPNPTKWDRSGVVVESAGHDQYRVKVDGSGRITLRNRRFLRSYTPATPSIRPQQPPAHQPTSSADQCPHPQPPVPPQPNAESKQITGAKPYVPTVALNPAPMSPLAPAGDNSPVPDIQSREPQLPVGADEGPQRPLCHLNCRPTQLLVLVAYHGHPNGTNQKQDNGSLESSN